jgi:hypothetical protein
MLNLDTHILLHALAGEVSSREAGLLRKQPWSISAIVIWSASWPSWPHRAGSRRHRAHAHRIRHSRLVPLART